MNHEEDLSTFFKHRSYSHTIDISKLNLFKPKLLYFSLIFRPKKILGETSPINLDYENISNTSTLCEEKNEEQADLLKGRTRIFSCSSNNGSYEFESKKINEVNFTSMISSSENKKKSLLYIMMSKTKKSLNE